MRSTRSFTSVYINCVFKFIFMDVVQYSNLTLDTVCGVGRAWYSNNMILP